MQDFVVIIETSWVAEVFSQSKPKGPGLLLGLVDLEGEKNGSWGEMSDQTHSFWTSHPQRSAGHQPILGGLCFVLLCAVHSRLSGETVWQELSLWKMYQRILHLWSRMGWRPVSALPREVQVSALHLLPLHFIRDKHQVTCTVFVLTGSHGIQV